MQSAWAAETTPFFCFLDYTKAELDGLGLSRTTTLAEGHGLRDHRFKEEGQATRPWPRCSPGRDDVSGFAGQGIASFLAFFP